MGKKSINTNWDSALEWYQTQEDVHAYRGIIAIVNYMKLLSSDDFAFSISHSTLMILKPSLNMASNTSFSIRVWNSGTTDFLKISLFQGWELNNVNHERSESVSVHQDNCLEFFKEFLNRL